MSNFVNKSSKSSRTPLHCLLSWANSKTSWGMLWCTLHHHGSQVAHHDIPSRSHHSSSLLEHRADSAYTTIVHFANGSVTWFHFECFTSFLWQIHHDSSLVGLVFAISPTYTTLNWCFQCSASGTSFSFPGLCWMSTLNKANVSCHFTCFDDNLGWVAKYFKVTLSIHTTTSLEPM